MEKPILLQQQQQQSTPIQQPTIIQTAPLQQPRHVLFDLTPLDFETEDIEEKTRRCYTTVKQMIAGKSAKECQDIYHQYIAANPQQHTDVLTMGLLVAILVEQNNQSDFYRDVVTFSKDNLALFSNYLNMIIIERITRISHHSIKQIFWVASQLIKGGTSSAENTCSNLIRQTAKGDTSPKNLFMVENLLDMLIENRGWIINSTAFLGPTVVYNVTRLIIDHLGPNHEAIRNREVKFVIGLMREKFDFVWICGKDFLRLLSNLHNRVPEFKQLYQDIFENDPKALHPAYEGPKQLIVIRTPRRLFQSCLTFDMERKISYLATQVRFGNQKRYQDWFHKQYLSGMDSTTLRSDLIRYICTIIHPSNEVLCSDIIPRWAIIGWLLTTVQFNVVLCRQALFFDWFAFDPKSDNIMNIEPAILVMYYSLKSHPQVTASLLDYLCGAHLTFNQTILTHVRMCIKKSLQQILEKRVLQSLVPLFVNSKYEPALKEKIKENFSEFCQIDNGVSKQNTLQTNTAQQPISNTNQVVSTNIEPGAINSTKLQGDVINIDSNPFNQAPQAPDVAKTKQENQISSVPTLGFQQPQKIQVLASNSPTKTKSKTATGDLKSQSTLNGTDPIEELINVGPPTAPIKQPNAALSLSTTSKQVTTPTVIKQEISKDNLSLVSKRAAESPLISNNNQFLHGNDIFDVSDENASDLPSSHVGDGGNHMLTDTTEHNTHIKVIYPFMTVKRVLPDEVVDSFGDNMNNHLNQLHKETPPELRSSSMRAILELLDGDEDYTSMIDDLGCHIANLVSEDFEERIHQDNAPIHNISEISPLLVLASHVIKEESAKPKSLALLVAVAKYFEATRFLLLYQARISQIVLAPDTVVQVPKVYQTFCEACKHTDLTRCLITDLRMMLTYDSDMFCYMLPCIFSEFAHATDAYMVVNNSDLIRMVTTAVDPINLHEFMCLCLTGSARIISREDPMTVIESSLFWESWEQYYFWKILTAQSVPIENYISIITKLNSKAHPEAMSSILINLQKISEPDVNLLRHIIDTYSKLNDQFVTAIIRYWSIRSDIKEMTKNLISLFDSKPLSPQMKRKVQTKTAAAKGGSTPSSSSSSSTPSSLSATLGVRTEKILLVLDSIRKRAPRNKLLAQSELLDALNSLEPLCNDVQRPKLAQLIQARPKPNKKKKLDKD